MVIGSWTLLCGAGSGFAIPFHNFLAVARSDKTHVILSLGMAPLLAFKHQDFKS